MSQIVVIPARYESSRFPGKPLADMLGKSLLYRVWRQCCKAFPSEKIFVATDDDRIVNHCTSYGMQWIMTSGDCLTGTDRVYDAVGRMLGLETIISVQGDEPNVNPEDICKIAKAHQNNPRDVHYGMAPICDEEKFRSYDTPKVVVSPEGYLLYSSRAPIPGNKANDFISAAQQVCVCALSPQQLALFASSGKTPLEKIEDVEILRFLELGVNVRMVEMTPTVPVDRPQDTKRAIRSILDRYKTWIFDCDGVLLDSNKIKSNAFHEVSKQFGEENAQTFLRYHKKNGGISRFRKFEYLQTQILGLPLDKTQTDRWIAEYADRCQGSLTCCDLVPGIFEFLKTIDSKTKYVVSGGEQKQVRDVLHGKNFEFDGIYGSPKSKSELVASLDIEYPAIFVGDAAYDSEVAEEHGLDFMFVSGYSEARQFVERDYYIEDFTQLQD